MKLALSLALAAAAVSSTVAMMGDQSCDFEEKYRWEPTKQVRVVNATGPNGPFCSPSAVDNLMRFAMEFGAMTGTDMSAYFKPINAHLDQTEAQSPYFVQYPYLLDVDVLVMPGLYNSLAMGSEKVKADMKDWVSKGGRVIYTGGSDIWRYEAASFFDMGGSNMIDFAYPTSVSAPDDRPSPYYLHRGDIEGTPLCSDEWAPPVFPWIPGTSPLADAFMVNGAQVPIMGNDREQTGFRFLYTGGPNMNFSVSGHLTTAFHYSPPHDDGEFGDVIYIGYDYEPREVQGEMWENTVLGYRNLMAVALWSEEKDDNNHGGACGPAIPGLHMIQDQSGNAHLVTPHCGGDSTFLPGMPMEQCDMLRMRVPEGYPPHMQVEMYRVPFTNSPGPVMPGHMCGGGDHYGQGGEQY